MSALGPSFRALVSVLLLVALVVPVVAVPSPTPHDAPDNGTAHRIVHQSNAISYLTFSNASTVSTDLSRVGMDVAGQLAAENAALHGWYLASRVGESFRPGADAGGPQPTARSRFDTLVAAVTRLRARHADAVAAFDDGRYTTDQFLREVAVADARSRALSDAVAEFSAANARAGEPVAPRRIAELKGQLLPLRGQVRSHLRTEMADPSESSTIYVETTGRGLVLSAITGQAAESSQPTYLREAHVPPAGDSPRPGSDLLDVLERAGEYYPVALNETNRGPVSVGTLTGSPYLPLAGIYPVTIDHSRGTTRTGDLVVLFAGDPPVPYRESQYLDVSSLPTRDPVIASSSGVSLSINRTYASGPMELRTTDTASGAPVQADVFVNGVAVGRTAPDGQRWTVEPSGPTNVTVAVGNRSVTTTV